jgi:hypothetical protein
MELKESWYEKLCRCGGAGRPARCGAGMPRRGCPRAAGGEGLSGVALEARVGSCTHGPQRPPHLHTHTHTHTL